VDAESALWEAFQDQFSRMRYEYPGLDKELANLAVEDAQDLGRRGAAAVLGPLMWQLAVGERWDVRQVAEFLGVSRQALYKRLSSGTALGVPGRGTTWFPTWQLDPDQRIIRPVTALIVSAFRDADPKVEAHVIAAWATHTNRLLEGKTPAERIMDGKADEAVAVAARRAAAGLAA
jgi:hypothetical protein